MQHKDAMCAIKVFHCNFCFHPDSFSVAPQCNINIINTSICISNDHRFDPEVHKTAPEILVSNMCEIGALDHATSASLIPIISGPRSRPCIILCDNCLFCRAAAGPAWRQTWPMSTLSLWGSQPARGAQPCRVEVPI